MSVRNIVLWIRDCFDDVAGVGPVQMISISPEEHKTAAAETENLNRFRRLLRSPIFLKWMMRIGTVVMIWQTYEFLFKY